MPDTVVLGQQHTAPSRTEMSFKDRKQGVFFAHTFSEARLQFEVA